ncbi:MAG: hypothetical protein RBU30_16265 [Polyangia bacterium]|jgi:hypothetical protein|nr:hypothetical protein [Polyangia bacterium]
MPFPDLGEYAKVVVQSTCQIQLPQELTGPSGLDTGKFLEAAISGERLVLLWQDGVTLHDATSGALTSRWTEMGIGLDFADCSPLGVLLLTQADRRDAPDGSAQQVTLLHPETLAPIFSKPATSFGHERLGGDVPLCFERGYLANDGILWAVAHEWKSGAERTVLFEITREGKAFQVFVLAEPLPTLKQLRAVDHVGERMRKVSLSQLTCSADRRWVHLIGKFDLWEIDVHTGQGTLENPVPLRAIKKLTTFVRDMKMERVFWDIQNRFLLVTPDHGKEFVIFNYQRDPKADEHSLQIAKIGVWCNAFQKQPAGLYVWEKGKARPMLFKEQMLDRTQMFSPGDGRYLVMGDFGEEVPLIVFDTYTWKSLNITANQHPELVPVGVAADDTIWGLEGQNLLRVLVEKGEPPKSSKVGMILGIVIGLAAVAAGLLYYFLIYQKG